MIMWGRHRQAPASRSRDWAGKTVSAPAKATDAISSGIEGARTPTPTQWDMSYFDTLFGYEWELVKGPGGAHR